ncbi:hypothetical protein G5V58_17870 [Nocardioides anomalus]|uniref:Polysaccharide chain length determinant N-terminal domain-containing protein n=1 Tax=Nocardioides anomalus TaxID=2712223 RepID=A0A6G6WGQ9_9ACTN|nr:hypothetical protein [Nocardioides anomalus]QIG44396.1 hypothetical protein G5V58_17870 [Nocardioides anomalus]
MSTPATLPLWSDYTQFVRRHAAVFGVLMLVGVLLGGAWSLRQTAVYSATTSIELAPVPKYITLSTGDLVAPAVTIDTDAQLVLTPRVLGAISDVLGIDPDRVRSHLSVTAAPLSRVLFITIQASSPTLAARAADAAANQLIEVRGRTLGALRQDQLRQLRFLVSSKERDLARQQSMRVVIPESDDIFNEVVEFRAALDELQDALQEPARVLRPAAVPAAADYRNTEVPVVSGLMLGMLAAVLTGAARDRFSLLLDVRALARSLSRRRPDLLSTLSRRATPVATTIREDNHVA